MTKPMAGTATMEQGYGWQTLGVTTNEEGYGNKTGLLGQIALALGGGAGDGDYKGIVPKFLPERLPDVEIGPTGAPSLNPGPAAPPQAEKPELPEKPESDPNNPQELKPSEPAQGAETAGDAAGLADNGLQGYNVAAHINDGRAVLTQTTFQYNPTTGQRRAFLRVYRVYEDPDTHQPMIQGSYVTADPNGKIQTTPISTENPDTGPQLNTPGWGLSNNPPPPGMSVQPQPVQG